MKIKILFLKVCLLAVGGIVLLFNIFVFPHYPLVMLQDYFLIGSLYVSALLFYYLILQAFKILYLVEHDQAFSDKSLFAVRNIKWATAGMGLVYLALIPKFMVVTAHTDAPGLMLIATAIVMLPMIISTFVAVLQQLLQNAITLKQENDFTV